MPQIVADQSPISLGAGSLGGMASRQAPLASRANTSGDGSLALALTLAIASGLFILSSLNQKMSKFYTV
jgi:hypothetical protein